MRNLLVFSFIAFICFTYLHSYTIEETLSQIESLKKELSHNEQIVEEKISNLKKPNPLFADQDPFESSDEYAERLKKGQPIIDNIRKQYLDDLWKKLGILRGRLFETENVSITLSKYDPDAQIYPMSIKHLDYRKDGYYVEASIPREKAKLLYQNWDKVKKTGILTIDIGDKIVLSKIKLQDPISGFNFTYIFKIYFSINFKNEITSATLSPNGKLLAVGTHNIHGLGKHIFLYDLENKKRIYSSGNSNGETHVRFDKNNKYFIAEYSEYKGNPTKVRIYDISNGDWQYVIRRDYSIFNEEGDLICTIDDLRTKSPDGKYEVRLEGPARNYPKEVNIYRTFAKVESDILVQKVISRPPLLSASVSFNEPSGNQYLDALEKGEIAITITNNGEGPSKGLTIKFNPDRIEGLNYDNSYIEEIPTGEFVTVSIPIEAYDRY